MTEAQNLAIQYVHSNALNKQSQAAERIGEILVNASISSANMSSMITSIRNHAQVTLNFHPDRVLPTGLTVAEGLLGDGIYRGQFETSVSNGSRTAFPGGERDHWEELLFGQAYHRPDVRNEERPKYGGLNLMNYADGASPRFGSCHMRLYPHMLSRCTFTFGDSHAVPECVGTIDCFSPLLATLLEAAARTKDVLGSRNVDVEALVRRIQNLDVDAVGLDLGTIGRSLDYYIEAQIHSMIDLSVDVEALVADPSFQGTYTGSLLEEICLKYNIHLDWHAGFRMDVQSVPDDFRGPAMPPLAERIDRRFAIKPGRLDAATIGLAAASLHSSPEDWQDSGTYEETLQHLKQLWHVLVRFGRPFTG